MPVPSDQQSAVDTSRVMNESEGPPNGHSVCGNLVFIGKLLIHWHPLPHRMSFHHPVVRRLRRGPVFRPAQAQDPFTHCLDSVPVSTFTNELMDDNPPDIYGRKSVTAALKSAIRTETLLVLRTAELADELCDKDVPWILEAPLRDGLCLFAVPEISHGTTKVLVNVKLSQIQDHTGNEDKNHFLSSF